MPSRPPPQLEKELINILAEILVKEVQDSYNVQKEGEQLGARTVSSEPLGRDKGPEAFKRWVDEKKTLPEEEAGSRQPRAAEAVVPRLLDLKAAANYLGVSGWTLRSLEWAGVIRRVRVPTNGDRELRKLLFDRHDLDGLIEAWKDPRLTSVIPARKRKPRSVK